MSIRSMAAQELKAGQSAEVMALVDETKAVLAIKTTTAPDFNLVRVCVERLLETCRTLAASIADDRVKNQVLFRVGVRKTPSSPARGLFMRLNTCLDKASEADHQLDTAKQPSTDPTALPKKARVELAEDQQGFAADDLAVVIAVVVEMSEAVFDAVRTRR